MGAEYSMSRSAAFDIEGKRFVIMGGTAGIGLGIAKGLVEAGASAGLSTALLARAFGDMRR
jgi:NAD(P)-dependent dehydrogenase (short-subunit alcohol dehydrogenase family)